MNIREGIYTFYNRTPLNTLFAFHRMSIVGALYAKAHRWGESVEVEDGKFTLTLCQNVAAMWISEKHLWPIEYEMDVRGKRVLDVGAGCGESASFYLNRGAAKVSAVESDLERVSYLEKNKVRNNWNLDIIPGRFSLNHLIIPHDALKMDIEGWEIQLLKSNLDSLGLARIEIHPMFIGKERASAIVRKFGLRRVHGMVWGSP